MNAAAGQVGLSADPGRPYRAIAWLLELCSRRWKKN
jgi:hypothetical protein